VCFLMKSNRNEKQLLKCSWKPPKEKKRTQHKKEKEKEPPSTLFISTVLDSIETACCLVECLCVRWSSGHVRELLGIATDKQGTVKGNCERIKSSNSERHILSYPIQTTESGSVVLTVLVF
jgi:hypothetical protein